MDDDKPNLPLSQQPGFVSLPSDPNIPLTPEQLKALFSGDVKGVVKEMVRLALENLAKRGQADVA